MIINVPDNKYGFFSELLQSIDFVNKFNEAEYEIMEREKKLIRQRIKNAKPENFKNWEDIKDQFILD